MKTRIRKRIQAILAILMMVVSLLPNMQVNAAEDPGSGSTTTVYFYNSDTWASVNAHIWGSTGGDTEWPGIEATPVTDTGWDGWYKVDVNAPVGFHVIFNDGGSGGNEKKAPDIYTSDKLYITMKGEFATKSAAETAINSTTVYFYNSDGWDSVNAHIYSSKDGVADTSWPGIEATPVTDTGWDGWYKVDVNAPVGFNVIFNNTATGKKCEDWTGNGLYFTTKGIFATKVAADNAFNTSTTTVYFYNSEGWDAVGAHAYKGADPIDPTKTWPGIEATPVTDTGWDGWYQVDINAPVGFNIIFNNNVAVGTLNAADEVTSDGLYVTMNGAFTTKEAAEASVKGNDVTRVYFYNSGDWDAVGAHAYKGDVAIDPSKAWPGIQAMPVSKDGWDGWYQVDIVAPVGFNIIFNNNVSSGTLQAPDKNTSDGLYFTMKGAFATKAEAEAEANKTTVYFYNSEGWDAVGAHAYKGVNAIDSTKPWPGIQATPVDGWDGWYQVDINALEGFNIIFNNNVAIDTLAAPDTLISNKLYITMKGAFDTKGAAEAAFDESGKTMSYVWYYNVNNWNLSAYVWGDAGEVLGGWPGAKPTQFGDSKWYYVELPTKAETHTIFFNSAKQTERVDADIINGTGGDFFVTGTNQDEVHIYTSMDDAESALEIEANSTRMFYYNPDKLDLHAYIWGDGINDLTGGWPGPEMKQLGNYDWYYADVPTRQAFHIVFNDNGSDNNKNDVYVPNDAGSVYYSSLAQDLYTDRLVADQALGVVYKMKIPNVDIDSNTYYNFQNFYYEMYLYENTDTKVVEYGNVDRLDATTQWKVIKDDSTGLFAIQNKGTSEYVTTTMGFSNSLQCTASDTPLYLWRAETGKDAGFVFMDNAAWEKSSDKSNVSCINMESLSGNAELTVLPKTWGTPQWKLEAPLISEPEAINIPDSEYVRIKNQGGNYLYEIQSSHVVAYDKIDADDSRSQWKINTDSQDGSITLTNRASQRVMTIVAGKNYVGTMEADKCGDGSKWYIEAGNGTVDHALFRSKLEPLNYLNILSDTGYAKVSFVSNESSYALWGIEEAPDTAVNKETPAQSGDTGNSYLIPTESDTVYSLSEAFHRDNSYIFTVFADEAGTSDVTVNYSASQDTDVQIAVNGKTATNVTMTADSSAKDVSLDLQKGMNTVTVTIPTNSTISINNLVFNTIQKNVQGATNSYTEYEAESGRTNAVVLSDDRTFRDAVQSEASGRSAVMMTNDNDYVEFTLTKPTNSLVIRYNMPDSEDGQGIQATLGFYVDGNRTQDLNLTSKYEWVYGTYPYTNNPSDGQSHRYFDESSFLFDTVYPAGTVIRLQKDAKDTADWYTIDLVDTELVEHANLQPENSLSIKDYGAIANDDQDDTDALNNCMAAAHAAGKEVWIPEGTFDFTNDASIPVNYEGLTIRGAGMWKTILEGDGVGFMIKADDVSFYDFKMVGTEFYRDDALGRTAFEAQSATSADPLVKNLTIQNIWVEHEKVGVWTTYMDFMHIVGCRIRNTFADGINLCGGTSHTVIEQNSIRNTGDDAIAMWSSNSFEDAKYGGYDTENVVRYNTAGLQCLANNVAIYGGRDITISNNYLYDTIVAGGGINISTNFEPVGFDGSVTIENNVLVRCGSRNPAGNADYGAIWLYVTSTDMGGNLIIENNRILDSSYQGLSLLGYDHAVSNEIAFRDNDISNSGTWGVNVSRQAAGSMLMKNNAIVSSGIGEIYNGAGEKFLYTIDNSTSTVDLTGNVKIIGTLKCNETLFAIAEGYQSNAELTYSWYRSGSDTPIQTGSSNKYKTVAEDINKTITVKVNANGYSGRLEVTTTTVDNADVENSNNSTGSDTTTNEDGSKTQVTTIHNPDGSTTVTDTTVKTDGSKVVKETTSSKSTYSDGSIETKEFAKVIITATNGSTLTSVTNTTTNTKSDGSSVKQSVITINSDTTTATKIVKTDKDGRVTSSTTLIEGGKAEVSVSKKTAMVSINISQDLLNAVAASDGSTDVSILISSATAMAAITNSSTNSVAVTVQVPSLENVNVSDVILSKEVVSKAAESKKALKVSVEIANNDNYTVNIKAKDLINISGDLNLSLDSSSYKEVSKEDKKLAATISDAIKSTNTKTSELTVIGFSDDKVLGAGVTLTYNVSDIKGIKAGDTVYVYRYNSKTNKLEEVANNSVKVNADGTITTSTIKGGDFIVSADLLDDIKITTLTDKITAKVTDTSIKAGSKTTFKVSLPDEVKNVTKFDKKSDPVGQEEAQVTFKISDRSIAKIDSKGNVTALKAGKVQVTVTIILENGERKLIKKTIIIK